MVNLRHFTLVLLLATLPASSMPEDQPDSPAMLPQPLVRQVDHILIGSEKPEELFQLFSEKLGLPIAWPFRSYGLFSSGGVNFGNVNIELIRSDRNQSGLRGVALEPAFWNELPSALDAQHLKHGEPVPFYQVDGSGTQRLRWTTLDLPTLAPAGAVFFCKYSFDVAARRSRSDDKSHDGGPLGIESVEELVIGASDMAVARHDWTVLLGSSGTDQEAVWRSGSGPAIRLVPARKDHLAQIRIKVKSLERARTFLKSENLLGIDTQREISIDPARVAGADIRFLE